MEWMLMPYRRYADFSGRSRRKEYWMFVLLSFLVVLAAVVLMGIGGTPASESGASASPLFWLGGALLAVFVLGSIIPSVAVQVRRFHDQDRSGWMVLLAFIPYIGGLIVLVFMCLEGNRGPNRFGPDPKDPTSANVFN